MVALEEIVHTDLDEGKPVSYFGCDGKRIQGEPFHADSQIETENRRGDILVDRSDVMVEVSVVIR